MHQLFSTCLNAVTLALMDAGVPLNGVQAAITCAIIQTDSSNSAYIIYIYIYITFDYNYTINNYPFCRLRKVNRDSRSDGGWRIPFSSGFLMGTLETTECFLLKRCDFVDKRNLWSRTVLQYFTASGVGGRETCGFLPNCYETQTFTVYLVD